MFAILICSAEEHHAGVILLHMELNKQTPDSKLGTLDSACTGANLIPG